MGIFYGDTFDDLEETGQIAMIEEKSLPRESLRTFRVLVELGFSKRSLNRWLWGNLRAELQREEEEVGCDDREKMPTSS